MNRLLLLVLLLVACAPAEPPADAVTESGTTAMTSSTTEVASTTQITTTDATTAALAPTATTPPVTSTAPQNPVRFGVEEVSDGLVRLSLDNGETSAIGYNLCSSELQRDTGANWESVATDEVCTQQMLALNPGADATFEKRLPTDLPPGDYRFMTRIENPFGGAQATLTTKSFKRS
ncbi:MAG TPA: hypothetical protein VF787_08770 [Thermoanaerobaculia bacterium]